MSALALFDLDGTLVNSIGELAFAVNAALAEIKEAPFSTEEIRLLVGMGLKVLVERALSRRGSKAPAEEVIYRVRFYYARILGQQSELYPGVKSGLRSLFQEGIPLCVFTNKPGDFARDLLEKKGISRFFQEVISADDIGARKPSPQGVRMLRQRFFSPRKKTFFVGDSKIDILCAKRARVLSLAVLYGYGEKRSLLNARPDFIARDFSQATDLVRKLVK